MKATKAKKAAAPQPEFVPITTDNIEGRPGDQVVKEVDGKRVATYVILLPRSDHLIAKIVGPHKAGTPVKIDLPKVYPMAGVKKDDANFVLHVKAGTEPKKAGAKRTGPKRDPNVPTKMDKCREIFKANPNLSKVDMVAKFIAEAACTPMGANTYYLTIKKG